MRTPALILILLLSTLAQCETDISLNNCPDDYDIEAANKSSGIGTGQMAVFFFSPFTDTETVARVENIVIQSDQAEYDKLAQKQYAIPFVLIAVLFGITFMTVLACVVFEKSCPPCHSWRRDFSKRPYEKFEVRCVAFFAVLFALGILGTSIAAFSIIPRLQDKVQSTKCAVYIALDVALNGDDEHWGGFSHIKNQVGNISMLLPAANTQINLYFDDDDLIKGAMDNMREENLAIYSSNRYAQVDTPDPNATAADLKTDSYFIQNLLGPNGTDNTMVYEVDTALASTARLSDQANEIINSAFILVESAATIQANTDAGQRMLSMYEAQLNSYKVKLDNFSDDYFDPFFNWGIYVVQVIIGFVLVGSLAILIGAVSIQVLDIYDCRHFLHFGWVVYGITYFGVIFIAYFALPIGSVGYTFCEFYGGMLVNETEYHRIGQYDSQHVLNRLDVCVFGDGNVLEKFLIAEEMNTVSELFVNIDLFNEYDDSTNDKYIDQTISQDKISEWLGVLADYRDGIEKDNDPLLTTDANCMYALDHMNEYTLWTTSNAGDAVPRCTRDRWVYDEVDCATSEHVYDEAVDDSLYITMTYVSCFSFNSMFSTTSASIWTLTDIIKRYKQKKQECPGAYSAITGYAESITAYRDSRIDLFQNLIDQMTDLQSSHNSFDLIMTDFRSNLASFSSTLAIRDLNNFVTNEIDGLLVSSSCNPIGDRLRLIYNTFCVDAMGHTVQLGFCLMILLCLMIGGVFTACIFAQRTATIRRLFTIHEKNFGLPEQSVHSETFDRKKSESSSSSSSSEQD